MYRDQFLPIINPATGEKLGTVPVVSREEVPKAVRVGRKAFTGWCQVPWPNVWQHWGACVSA